MTHWPHFRHTRKLAAHYASALQRTRLQITEMFEKAFPGQDVLGSLEENDEDGDPEEDVLEEAMADVEGVGDKVNDVDLDLSKMKL